MTAPVDPFVAAMDERIRLAVEARVAELQRPLHVTQRTVASIVGIPPGTFLEAARAGEFPSYKVQRLVFAKLEDVVSYIEAHPVRRHGSANDSEPAASSEAKTLARAGFRRVG